MNSLTGSIGPQVLAQLRNAAEGIGATDYLAPSSITYYLGPKTQTYNPDTGFGTATWTQEETITDSLVGHFNWNVIANVQNVESNDIKVLIAKDDLDTAPTPADECLYDSNTYDTRFVKGWEVRRSGVRLIYSWPMSFSGILYCLSFESRRSLLSLVMRLGLIGKRGLLFRLRRKLGRFIKVWGRSRSGLSANLCRFSRRSSE